MGPGDRFNFSYEGFMTPQLLLELLLSWEEWQDLVWYLGPVPFLTHYVTRHTVGAPKVNNPIILLMDWRGWQKCQAAGFSDPFLSEACEPIFLSPPLATEEVAKARWWHFCLGCPGLQLGIRVFERETKPREKPSFDEPRIAKCRVV